MTVTDIIPRRQDPLDPATFRRAEIERELGRPLPDLTREERTDFVSVMTGGETSNLLAWISAYAPEIFDAALAARSRTFAGELARRAELLDIDQDDENEPYCKTCSETVHIFQSHGDGWHHYRGEGTAASPVELYDAGHVPAVGWRPAAR
jgi:hypothetical protein